MLANFFLFIIDYIVMKSCASLMLKVLITYIVNSLDY